MFFLFFLDAHTDGKGWLVDDEVVLVARVVEVLGAADEVVEVLDTTEEVEVLEVLGAGAADDELELVEVVLNDLDEVLVRLVEALVDLVVVIYMVCVREGVDSLHRRTYRNTGWRFLCKSMPCSRSPLRGVRAAQKDKGLHFRSGPRTAALL